MLFVSPTVPLTEVYVSNKVYPGVTKNKSTDLLADTTKFFINWFVFSEI